MASSEYINAEPDPLRDFAEKIVDEMNSIHPEDVQRLYSVYVEPGFQVWVYKDALVFFPSLFYWLDDSLHSDFFTFRLAKFKIAKLLPIIVHIQKLLQPRLYNFLEIIAK